MSKLKNALVVTLSAIAMLCGVAGITYGTKAVDALAESETKISGASVTLQENVVVHFVAENVQAETAVMNYTYKGQTYQEEVAVTDGNATFSFDKVTPQNFSETIVAELVVAGETVDMVDTFSVQSYCEDLLASSAEQLNQSEGQNEAMRTLVVDMLYYGEATQQYRQVNLDNLATANLTQEQKELKSEYVPLTAGDRTLTGDASEKFSWYGAGLHYDYNVSLYFTIAVKQDITDLAMDVDGTKITEFTTKANGDVTYYTAQYTNVSATQFDKVYTVKVFEGETAIGQVATYSVKSYVYAMQDDANMGTLAQATYNYGKSAVAYNNAIASLTVTGAVTNYREGWNFNTESLVVKATAVNGAVTTVTDYDYSPKVLTKDTTEVVVSYGGAKVSVPVTVADKYSATIQTADNAKYTIEAEDTDLTTYSCASWVGNKPKIEGSSVKYLANMSGINGYVEYSIYSEVEAPVEISISGGIDRVQDLSTSKYLWNGEEFTTTASTVKGGWATMQNIVLGTATLKVGENTFRIYQTGTFPNLNSITFEVSKPTDLVTKTYRVQAESGDMTNWTTNSTYPFIKGNGYVENWWACKGSISYTFESEIEGTAEIYFAIGAKGTFVVANAFKLSMNGEKVVSNVTTPNPNNYYAGLRVFIATANVVKGTNTFVIEKLDNFANMDYIEFVVTGY